MRIHARILAFASALLLGALPAAAGDRALLIGVNDYKDDTISDLRGPAIDVANIHRLLVETLAFPEAGIKVLTETDATRAGVFNAIDEWLIAGTQPGDRIYIYFSGHGAQVQIPDGDGVRLTTGLVPYDASSSVAQTATSAGGLILGAQLGEAIRRMTGREVTIVVDACHSGSLTRGAEGDDVPDNIRTITPNGPADLDPADITDALIAEAKTGLRLLDFNSKDGTPMEGVAVWSAATMAQYSYDTAAGGVFTNEFTAGLRDRRGAFAGDRVSASSLLAYIRGRTETYCASHPKCAALGFTPELLAPDSYRAAILVPYLPGGTLLVEPVEVAQPEEVAEEATDNVDADAPPLVDLAVGVFSHDNDFGLEAAILPGNRVALGDTVRFSVRSGETGQVIVLDSGPDGSLRRIFPNAYSEAAGRNGIVAGGHTLTIPDESYPFEFTATDAGPGSLVVLVTEPGVDLQPLFESSDFEIIQNVDKALVAIAAQLQQPVLDPDPSTPNRARRWAFVTVPYMVAP